MSSRLSPLQHSLQQPLKNKDRRMNPCKSGFQFANDFPSVSMHCNFIHTLFMCATIPYLRTRTITRTHLLPRFTYSRHLSVQSPDIHVYKIYNKHSVLQWIETCNKNTITIIIISTKERKRMISSARQKISLSEFYYT